MSELILLCLTGIQLLSEHADDCIAGLAIFIIILGYFAAHEEQDKR